MEKQIIITKDGSPTIAIPSKGVAYHSIHGAIQESQHVFIEAGLKYILQSQVVQGPINIFELGLGTGLNALLTLLEAEKFQREVLYECVEAYPLDASQIEQLNYCQLLDREDVLPAFEKMHNCEWNELINITPHFSFIKHKERLQNYQSNTSVHLVYYDAFAPAAQPELWTRTMFDKIFDILQPAGILVTYCSKGEVRRNLIAAGFTVEKLPGPPGKREMIRAMKPGTSA